MKRSTMIISAVVVAIAGIGYWKIKASKPVAKTQYTLAEVSLGSVKKTVSASGTLQAWTTVDVKSKAGGRIDLLAVDVGSKVKKGQVVAKIDPTDSMLTFSQAKASTESAKAKETQSSETYRLTVAQSQISVNQAKASLDSSKANLLQAQARYSIATTQSDAQPSLTNSAIAQAKANYDSAVQALNKIDVTQTQDRASVQAAYDQAAANDRNAQVNLTRQQSLLAKGFVSQSTVDAAAASAEVTKATLASARAKLDTLGTQQSAERQSAQAAVQQAQAAYKSAQINAISVSTMRDSKKESQAAVMQAEAAVKTAQAQYDDAAAALRNGAIRQLDITSAQASVASAEASLTNAKTTLDQTTVTAPSDGVVLQKYVEQGTIITSGLSLSSTGTSIVQIGDVSRMYVDVAVDETDIASIREGENVNITFDAYANREFKGRVTKIDPMGVVESNVTTVHVRVEVDNTTEGFSDLKPQMNATCEFVEGEANNVVTVPSEAVHLDADGSSYVEVVATDGKDGNGGHGRGNRGTQPGDTQPMDVNRPAGGSSPNNVKKAGGSNMVTDIVVQKRTVTVGIEGDEATEIKSGLKPGEEVVVSKIEPVSDESAPKAAFGMSGMRSPRR